MEEISNESKSEKILCKILKVMGYFFMGGGFLGIFMGVRFEEWEEMIFKASTLALFFGGFRLESLKKSFFAKKQVFFLTNFARASLCRRFYFAFFLRRCFFALIKCGKT